MVVSLDKIYDPIDFSHVVSCLPRDADIRVGG